MDARRWTIEGEGVTAGPAVREHLGLSHRKLREMLDRQAVRVDGTVITDPRTPVAQGATVEVDLAAPRRARRGAPRPRILHEDRHLVVVAKPAGLLTVPRDADRDRPPPDREPNLEDWLRARFLKQKGNPTVFVVQRLDRGTSGVLLFPRTRFAYDALKPAFARHDIERRYRAIVVGGPKSDTVTLENLLVERRGRVIAAHPKEAGAKRAVTHLHVIARAPKHTLLELTLETGRRNQIRIQCALAGYPVLGDRTYGEAAKEIDRPALHARRLGFVHPYQEEPRIFEVEEPADFTGAWVALGGAPPSPTE